MVKTKSTIYSYPCNVLCRPCSMLDYNNYCYLIRFQRLDPFLATCRSVARYLVTVIQELTAVDQVPASVKEASHLVEHHENLLKATFEDSRILRLQQEGDAMLQSLEREQVNIGHTDDYK